MQCRQQANGKRHESEILPVVYLPNKNKSRGYLAAAEDIGCTASTTTQTAAPVGTHDRNMVDLYLNVVHTKKANLVQHTVVAHDREICMIAINNATV